jgi:hypothetical protein
MRRTTVIALCVTMLAAVSGPAGAATSTKITGKALLGKLTVRAESHADRYERYPQFGNSIDRNGDCQDTRSEVLQDESSTAVTYKSPTRHCAVATGTWVSWYDDKTWTDADDLQMDHVVALAEVWRSGAWDWTKARRVRYANDLGHAWTLDAVTSSVNQSKGDRDPAEWLPDNHVCKYARHWVAIKYRWKLSIDADEKAELKRILDGDCGDLTLTVPQRAT